jgi:hypothetical protein
VRSERFFHRHRKTPPSGDRGAGSPRARRLPLTAARPLCFVIFFLLAAACLALTSPARAQRLAVVAPEKSALNENFSEKLAASLAGEFKILDASLSETAFRSVEIEKPFNLTVGEAKLAGAAIGCDFFLLVRAENQRRYSVVKKDYFESYAVIYLASARSGRLVFWRLASYEDAQEAAAEKKLFAAADELAAEIARQIPLAAKFERDAPDAPKLPEIPDENSPEAKAFRPPLPYKRLRPAYTALASLYKIEASVEAEVDFDENGQVLRVGIVRWAGFGLDEAVAETVRRMNWRAAERDGRKLPVRALLRYNFRKIEKEG